MLHMVSVKGICVVRHTFLWRLAASHKEQMSPVMILVLFSIGGDARIRLIKCSLKDISLKA